MKMTIVVMLLFLAAIGGYQGRVYLEFDRCLQETERAFYVKEYGAGLSAINRLRENRWYKPLTRYQRLDIFELDKIIDFQRGRIEAELGNYKEAYAIFDRCINAKDSELAFRCLYQQGNIALSQGNSVAEKKWQAALEKNNGGHDFDTQVNLELLKR